MHCSLVEPNPKYWMLTDGAEVVVPHLQPAGRVEQRQRFGDAEFGPAPLCDQLELPEVLLGRLPGLAFPRAADVRLGGCVEARVGRLLQQVHGLVGFVVAHALDRTW